MKRIFIRFMVCTHNGAEMFGDELKNLTRRESGGRCDQ